MQGDGEFLDKVQLITMLKAIEFTFILGKARRSLRHSVDIPSYFEKRLLRKRNRCKYNRCSSDLLLPLLQNKRVHFRRCAYVFSGFGVPN